MDWFLYDRNFYHERVKRKSWPIMIQITHNFVICEVVSIFFFFFFGNLDISKIELKPKVTTDFRVKLTRHLLSQ